MDEIAQLQEALSQLTGVLDVKCAQDHNIASLLAQLVSILEPQAEPLSDEAIKELSQISNPIERFKKAAVKLGISDTESLKSLADSLKASGLLKTEA